MKTFPTPTESETTVDEVLVYSMAATRPGYVLVAESEWGVRAIVLGNGKEELLAEFLQIYPNAIPARPSKNSKSPARQAAALITNPHALFEPTLDIRGTAFQRRVWDALCRIPLGKTSSYQEIAIAVESPRGFRAVAAACAANPLAVVIPCHRVVRTDGDLSGYRWGVEWKERLLKNEAKRARPVRRRRRT